MLTEKTFTDLFNTWYQALCNFAFKFVDDRDLAEDLVQEVFVNMWNSDSIIIDHTKQKNYLFTSVKNACFTHFKKRELDESLISNMKTEYDSLDDLENELESIRIKLILLKAIETLPDKIKRSFKLTKIEGLTYEEAASFIGISPKTVEKQVARAYMLLRKMKEVKAVYSNL